MCFLIGEIVKTGVAVEGFPYSHFTLSQNVNILVKTKKAPKALKHKINIKNFCDMGVPTRGTGGSRKVVWFGSESVP